MFFVKTKNSARLGQFIPVLIRRQPIPVTRFGIISSSKTSPNILNRGTFSRVPNQLPKKLAKVNKTATNGLCDFNHAFDLVGRWLKLYALSKFIVTDSFVPYVFLD